MKIPARLQPFLFAAAACLALGAFAGYDLLRERSRSVEQARANTANLARLLEEHTRQSLRRVEGLLTDAEARIDDLLATGKPEPRLLEPPLKALLPGDGLISAMVWLSEDERALASTGGADVAPAAIAADTLHDWHTRWRTAPSAKLVIGRAWRGKSGGWQLPVGHAVLARDGRPAGALVAVLEMKTLQPVFDAVDTGKNGFVTLFSQDAWMLATAPRNDALFARNWGDSPMFREHLPRARINTVQQVVVRDGTERIYSYRALEDYPMVVSTGISMTDALADWRARARWDLGLLALVTAASLWGATLMARSTARRQQAESVSAEAARHTQAVIDNAADGILTFGPDGVLRSVNPAGAAMFGYEAAALVGHNVAALLPELDRAARSRSESVGRRQDGTLFPAEVAPTEVLRGGQPLHIVLVRDITERRRAQAAVADARDSAERSERFLRAITDNLPLRIAYVDTQLRYRFANQAHVLRFGQPREAIIGRTRQEITGQPVEPELMERLQRALQGQQQRFEVQEERAGRSWVIETQLVPDVAPDGRTIGFYSASSDVTERHEQQRRIERALAERETLLREVYHRVKNNLQVVQSLLNLQRRGLPAGAARTALDDSVQRVHAMALVHEKLYQTGRLDAVALPGYTTELLRHLGETAGAARRQITLQAQVQDIEATLELAVPFGLLVTELVGNSLKHAFPENPAQGRGGHVQVRLRREGAAALLTVQDDGIGLPEGFEINGAAGMGLQLAAGLASQLGGRLQARHEGGAVFEALLTRMV
jgi:PAS domain S-box-containing protein